MHSSLEKIEEFINLFNSSLASLVQFKRSEAFELMAYDTSRTSRIFYRPN